jgi:hypothetical protein
MDIYTFISSIVASIAWPLSIILIVWILRSPLYKLVPLLKKLKYKEFELEFNEVLKEIDPTSSNSSSSKSEEPKNPAVQKFLALIEISPRAAIVEAWLNVETALIECGIRNGVFENSTLPKSSAEAANLLFSKEVISSNQVEAFKNLQLLRNKAVHNQELFEVNENIAKEYVGKSLLLALNFNKQ